MVGENTLELIAALVSLLAIIVTVITAVTSTRSSAFNDLKAVVEALKADLLEKGKTIERLNRDFARERRLRMAYEDYIHALLMQLADAKIVPVDIKVYVKEEDDE